VSREFFRSLARDAADRYPANDRFARHFAYGKTTGDPVYEYILAHGLVRDGASFLDVGCGQGLTAALLETARERHGRGDWPSAWPAPARPSTMRGIDLSEKDIRRAQAATPEHEWIVGDMCTAPFGTASTILVLDVLHYVEAAKQDQVLDRLAQALEPGGQAIVRVADANGSLGYHVTLWADRIMCVVRGQRVHAMHTRPLGAWIDALAKRGLVAEPVPMSEGTPFTNVLLRARAR
jgi:SAM-dependent methyltransferase